MRDKLHAHFRAMQNMACLYLQPAPYVDREGREHTDEAARTEAFVGDMIYMLDGPEQREAEKAA
jgi:hypothetical protein